MADPYGTAAGRGWVAHVRRSQAVEFPPWDLDERAGQIDLPVGAQNHQIWTASDLIGIQPTSAQNGGDARQPEVLA